MYLQIYIQFMVESSSYIVNLMTYFTVHTNNHAYKAMYIIRKSTYQKPREA